MTQLIHVDEFRVGGKEEEKQEAEDSILDEFLREKNTEALSTEVHDYKNQTLKELYEMLDAAVKNEDYERAAKIRDEISKRD